MEPQGRGESRKWSAGRRAFLDRKREAARLASVPGWFAAAPGTDRKVPAFPGPPPPSLSGGVDANAPTPGPSPHGTLRRPRRP